MNFLDKCFSEGILTCAYRTTLSRLGDHFGRRASEDRADLFRADESTQTTRALNAGVIAARYSLTFADLLTFKLATCNQSLSYLCTADIDAACNDYDLRQPIIDIIISS